MQEPSENTFAGAAEAAAQIMAEMPRYRMYRITYAVTGAFLTFWNGENAEHARNLCAEYYRVARKKLVATLEP